MKKTIFLGSLLLLIVACKSAKFPNLPTVNNMPEPPGTVQMGANLYVDEQELSNFSYQEYLYWTKMTYGAKSTEYQTTLPDTNAWARLDEGYSMYVDYYLRHPAYRDFPLVGISYEQAQNYSEWRSDRVFQYMLIAKGIIPFYHGYSRDSIFTIEKYFSGNYLNYKPDPVFNVYPVYSLPDEAAYFQIARFADSLNTANWTKCHRKKCGDELLISNNCLRDTGDWVNLIAGHGDPVCAVDCSRCSGSLITHLKGNVRELTTVKGTFYGNSFMDSCNVPTNRVRTDTNLVNAYTGFRNSCSYKVWGK